MSTTPAPETNPYDAARHELHAIRRQLHLTQKEMGARLGVEQNTISRYERGTLAVPPMALLFARSLLGVPQEPIVYRVRQRLRGKTRWDVAFVLVHPLTPQAQCWHGPDPASTDLDLFPCAGDRWQFVALLPPTPHIPQRRTETVTCERHAVEALFWLRKQYTGWLGRILRPHEHNWHARWVQTLARHRAPKDTENEKA